jgi:hypothetical protein
MGTEHPQRFHLGNSLFGISINNHQIRQAQWDARQRFRPTPPPPFDHLFARACFVPPGVRLLLPLALDPVKSDGNDWEARSGELLHM